MLKHARNETYKSTLMVSEDEDVASRTDQFQCARITSQVREIEQTIWCAPDVN